MIKRFKNLTIVGTSHISRESLSEVMRILEQSTPSVVALELDQGRFHALFSTVKPSYRFADIRRLGLQGFLFAIIGSWVENKLGSFVGMEPGDEMRLAAKVAKKASIPLAFIDQDIVITLKRLHISWRERFRFVWDTLRGLVGKNTIPFDLATTPGDELVIQLLDEVKLRYPSIYKTLIEERNKVMAHNIYHLMQDNDSVVAVIGAGHVEGVLKLLKKDHSRE